MILSLNIFTAIFIFLVAIAVIIASWDVKDRAFYFRSALLLIPLISQIRQILAASDQLENYPLFVFLVYFLLRCLGPLLNWHTHDQLKKPIRFFNALNIVTYLLLGYVSYDFVKALSLPAAERTAYVIYTFENSNLFSFSYPIVQLLHVGQAIYLVNKSEYAKKIENIFYIRVAPVMVAGALIALQLSYVFLERTTVELVVAPIIFITIYSIVLFVSVRYSVIHNQKINLVEEPSPKQIPPLSERENQVLRLIAMGKTDKEISEEIHLSLNTVRTYCKRIYTKLNTKNRTEAANHYNQAS